MKGVPRVCHGLPAASRSNRHSPAVISAPWGMMDALVTWRFTRAERIRGPQHRKHGYNNMKHLLRLPICIAFACAVAAGDSPVVTMAKYERIEKGMTYEHVCAIIGAAGEEIASSDTAGYTTVTYSWKNPDGSNMNAMFQDGGLISKAKSGLPKGDADLTAGNPPAPEDKPSASQKTVTDQGQTGAEPGAQRVTVELKTGEHVEGTFKQATPAATVIDVAGQTITISADKIQAMSFGVAVTRPSAGQAPFQEALDELEGLQSVTGSGISYLEYSRRALDAKVKVDRYLASAADSPLRSAISLAMREYELASQEWNEAINPKYRVHETLLRYIDDRMLSEDPKCPAFAQWHDLVRQNFARNWYVRSFAVDGLITRYQGVVWTCASDQVAEAQRLSIAAGDARQ